MFLIGTIPPSFGHATYEFWGDLNIYIYICNCCTSGCIIEHQPTSMNIGITGLVSQNHKPYFNQPVTCHAGYFK